MNTPHVRFGGTSWVVAGNFAENLKRLSRDVRDMEIVLFEAPGWSNMLMRSEVLALRELCGELEMTCTVHFPVDIPCHMERREREKSEDICLYTTELFEPLEPFGWVVHLVGRQDDPFPGCDLERWLENAEKSAARIANALPDKRNLCAETLGYDFTVAHDLVRRLGISICFDAGHVIKLGLPVLEQLQKFAPETRIVHLHGVMPDGTDHADLSFFDEDRLRALIGMLEEDKKERVVTIEVFEDDYDRSVEVLKAVERSWVK